jgi:uncharacterized membrane protein YidH (DUF202 family)
MNETQEEQLLISEVKLLLAEKRTYLAMFRTGVAICGLSVTAIGVLVIESNFLDLFSVSNTIVIGVFLVLIAIIGGWLIYRSRERINHINDMIHKIESKDQRIADILIE